MIVNNAQLIFHILDVISKRFNLHPPTYPVTLWVLLLHQP